MTLSAKKCCAAAVFGAALLTVSAGACAQAAMPGMGPVANEEKMMWENIKTGKFDAVYAVMTPEFVYAGPEGLGGRDESIAGLKTCKYNSYSLSSPMTRMIGKDAVLVSYVATVDADCGPAGMTMHFAGDTNCTSVWVKRDGKWLALAHTAAVVMKMPMPPAPPPPPPAQ